MNKLPTKATFTDPTDLPQMHIDLTADERCSPPKKQKCFDVQSHWDANCLILK